MSIRSSRKRTLTEKSKEYQLEILYQLKKEAEARIRGAMADVDAILNSAFSRASLSQRKIELDEDLRSLLEVHAKCQTLNEDEREKENDERALEQLDKEVFQLKGKIIRAMSEASVKENKPSSKASSRSSSRTSSRLHAKFIEEETRLKELKIESNFLKRKHEAELAAQQALVNIEIKQK